MEKRELEFIAVIIQGLLDRGLVFRSPWLNTKEAAAYCKLSESYLNTLRSKGGGPAVSKQGRICVYNRDDLDRWLRKAKNRDN